MEMSEWGNKGFSIFIVDIYSSVPREHSYKNIALGVELVLFQFNVFPDTFSLTLGEILIMCHIPLPTSLNIVTQLKICLNPKLCYTSFLSSNKCENYLLRVAEKGKMYFIETCLLDM